MPTEMLIPTPLEILADVQSHRPRGWRVFTIEHAIRIEQVLLARSVRVGAGAEIDFDALSKEALTPRDGAVGVTGLAIMAGFFARYLLGLAVRWAMERAWNRYRGN